MGYFEFVMRTKLCSGENALEHLPYELSRLKVSKPLIITDKTLEKLGMLKLLTDALGDMAHALFTDVPPDSDLRKSRRRGETLPRRKMRRRNRFGRRQRD